MRAVVDEAAAEPEGRRRAKASSGKKVSSKTGPSSGASKKKGVSRRVGKRAASVDAGGEAGGEAGGDAPRIVPREEHPVSRKAISRSALKVLDRLHEGGFGAYLVGGGVRDALVGIAPKDFDIATDASPEDIRALFRNSRIIGRRFRLVHVVFGREIIEVATFRAAHDKGEGGEVGASGRIVRDNVFGSISEDAHRRDFSVNALYYNVADRSVVDYVGGLEDIEKKVFRLIGDPLTRCEEDPVRVLRAVRLSAKLGFTIEKDTGKAMEKVAPELRHTPPARLFEEVLKLFQGGYAERSFAAVVEHDLLRYLFPLLAERLKGGEEDGGGDGGLRTMLDAALANTDRRVAEGKPITPSYLLAFMLWPDVEERAREEVASGVPVHEALREGAEDVLSRQLRVISIPRRFSGPMKEIWQMQPRLERNRGRRALALMEDRRFRAAYDFLCLRARAWTSASRTAPTGGPASRRWRRTNARRPRPRASPLAASGATARPGRRAELPPVVPEDDLARGRAVGAAPAAGRTAPERWRRCGGGCRGGARCVPDGRCRRRAIGRRAPPRRPEATARAARRKARRGEGAVHPRPVRAAPPVTRRARPTARRRRSRRRRRRKPGGDRARPPGGDG